MATNPLIPNNADGQKVILVVAPVVNAGDNIVPIKMLYGSGAPSNADGDEKDFYMNIDNYYLFGPKTQGLWGTGINLREKGEQGPPGDINLEKIEEIIGPSGANAEIVIDLSLVKSVFKIKLNASMNKITLVNTTTADASIARTFTAVLEQGTGSNEVTDWDARIRWPDGLPPELSYQISTYDIFHFLSLNRGDSFIPMRVAANAPV
ncbi:hypothetical protein PJWF_00036 [Achromobacter phage JWF]|uniref:hypothetical protein n=1 Tax=Achromobacter phage JWF TaxID=1589748 RepID=UPI000588E09D|nr:hypothetical protein AXJ13_gp036 [Achromobacter phage JWF]AJD82930.1 hypothetical protein PJWF_00036 [Achromobacter phage JWF]